MIQANEIRVGNKLTDNVGFIYMIDEINNSTKTMFATIGGRTEQYHIDLENVIGIPLTEEWLVRFGLLNNDIGIWNNGDAIYFQYGSDHDKGTELLYVHQLQNLYFALTNTELTSK